MKNLILILLFICQTAWTSEDHAIRLNLTPEDSVYSKLMEGLWEYIPQRVDLGVVPLDREGSFNAQISHGNINLGHEGKPLFRMETIGKNKVRLHWDLSRTSAYLYVRTDFYVEILGIRIRKHEDFHVHASSILGGYSDFSLVFNDGGFELEPLGNGGLAAQHVRVESTDDDFTSWVLERMRSRVNKVLNQKLRDYINGPEGMGKVRTAVNENLRDFQSIDMKFSSYATDLRMQFSQFDFEKNRLAISLDMAFDRSAYELHSCARNLEGAWSGFKSFDPELKINKENLNNGTVLVPHDFINQVLFNLGVSKIDDDGDEVADEPLFCTGYEDRDASGDLEEFEVGGKKMQIRIWSTPEELPKIHYLKGNLISLDMKTKFRITPEGSYPKLSLKGEEMQAIIKPLFEISLVEGKGLMLKVMEVKMELIKGKFYYKHARFIPKIKISFKRIKEKFEGAIFDKLKKAVKDKVLLDEVMGNGLKLKLEGVDVLESDHQLRFKLL